MGKIIVTPGPGGLVSNAGQIIGSVLPEGAVLAELPAGSTDIPVMSAALLRDGAIVIVPNWKGSGPWYVQDAPAPVGHRQSVREVKLSEIDGATVDRLTAIEIDMLDFDPEAAGWKMEPRAETAAEKKAREKADADAKAEAEIARKAARKVSAVQLRRAANKIGIRGAIDSVMADSATNTDIKDFWEYSTEYAQNDPIWAEFMPLISLPPEEISVWFDTAETF